MARWNASGRSFPSVGLDGESRPLSLAALAPMPDSLRLPSLLQYVLQLRRRRRSARPRGDVHRALLREAVRDANLRPARQGAHGSARR